MKLSALVDKDTAIGLRLSGLKDIYISEGDSSNKWEEIIKRDDIGIIIITEKIADEIKNKLYNFRIKKTIPIIVEIPDKHGRISHIDYISNLIKKAVGIEIIKDK
jgi:V/A-type H+-transporting ATPase subunit F